MISTVLYSTVSYAFCFLIPYIYICFSDVHKCKINTGEIIPIIPYRFICLQAKSSDLLPAKYFLLDV